MDIVDSFDFNIIWSIFNGLGSLAVFGVCAYFVSVKPGTDSGLLAAGSFIHLLTSLFYSIGIMILSRLYGVDFFSNKMLFGIVGGFNAIGTICFTAGIIILIINYVSLHREQIR